jgi:hypothetical protein
LPDFLDKNHYQDADDDIQHCPWQTGTKTSETGFQFLFSHPRQLQDFNTFMTHQHLEQKSFLDVYPLQEEVASAPPVESCRTLFVDIGGGVGHVGEALKQRHPDLPGRIILQDLPATIAQAPSRPGVEAMAHDYFTSQPAQDARYYYFRNVMHNLTDKDCFRILEQTRGAMSADSLILIDELVLPNPCIPPRRGCSLIISNMQYLKGGFYPSIQLQRCRTIEASVLDNVRRRPVSLAVNRSGLNLFPKRMDFPPLCFSFFTRLSVSTLDQLCIEEHWAILHSLLHTDLQNDGYNHRAST